MTLPDTQDNQIQQEDFTASFSLQRTALTVAALVAGGLVLIFATGVLFIFTSGDAIDASAARIAYFRDLMMIALLVEGILIIAAVAALIVQIARLVQVLVVNTKPILEKSHQTVQTVQQTTEFVSKQVVLPVIRFGGSAIALRTLIRELIDLRHFFKSQQGSPSNMSDKDQ